MPSQSARHAGRGGALPGTNRGPGLLPHVSVEPLQRRVRPDAQDHRAAEGPAALRRGSYVLLGVPQAARRRSVRPARARPSIASGPPESLPGSPASEPRAFISVREVRKPMRVMVLVLVALVI